MTSFAVNYGWTPELVKKDKELKEKYGAGAHITPSHYHAIPKGYSELERTPKDENVSFGKANNDKTNSCSKKGLLIGLGLLLSAAGLATFILTKGKKKPAKKFENIVKEFKKHNPEIADLDPIVTKLKNGKQKLEFKYVDKANNNINEMLILDKSGNFEKRISFQKYGDMSNYIVKDGLDNSNKTNVLKSKWTELNGNEKKISLQRLDGSKKDIYVRANDKAASISNQNWYVPEKESSSGIVLTNIYKNSGAPADVRQTVKQYSNDAKTVTKRFEYKAGQPKKEVDFGTQLSNLTKQQKDAMAELMSL